MGGLSRQTDNFSPFGATLLEPTILENSPITLRVQTDDGHQTVSAQLVIERKQTGQCTLGRGAPLVEAGPVEASHRAASDRLIEAAQ
jgi:hypothetical protein